MVKWLSSYTTCKVCTWKIKIPLVYPIYKNYFYGPVTNDCAYDKWKWENQSIKLIHWENTIHCNIKVQLSVYSKVKCEQNIMQHIPLLTCIWVELALVGYLNVRRINLLVGTQMQMPITIMHRLKKYGTQQNRKYHCKSLAI